MSGELIVRHLVSPQVLRDTLPGFDLQIGVPEQHAVEVKGNAPMPHAAQARRDLIRFVTRKACLVLGLLGDVLGHDRDV
jgi:hypothetical protein